jgi:hypothetical protein
VSVGPILVKHGGSRALPSIKTYIDFYFILFYLLYCILFYFICLGYLANIIGNKRKENLMGVLKHGMPTEVDIPIYKMPHKLWKKHITVCVMCSPIILEN